MNTDQDSSVDNGPLEYLGTQVQASQIDEDIGMDEKIQNFLITDQELVFLWMLLGMITSMNTTIHVTNKRLLR